MSYSPPPHPMTLVAPDADFPATAAAPANRRLCRQLQEHLVRLLEQATSQGFWGRVSLEVSAENGVIQNFKESVTQSHR